MKIKKVVLFFKLLPFVNLGIEIFNKDTCISLAASNFVSWLLVKLFFILVQIRSADRG